MNGEPVQPSPGQFQTGPFQPGQFHPGQFQPGSMHGVYGGGGHWVFAITLLVLFLVLIGVIVWGVLRLGSAGSLSRGVPPAAAPPRDPALDELRLRYARGELDRDQYLERARDLGAEVPSPPQRGDQGA